MHQQDTTRSRVVGLLPIGTGVSVGCYRSGHIIGYTTCKRMSAADAPDTYYVVELDEGSAAYLEASRTTQSAGAFLPNDCFISCIIVHPQNVAN